MKIFLLEDDEEDSMITEDLLRDIYGEKLEFTWVTTREAALSKTARKSFDVMLFDYFLGATRGLDVIREICEAGNDKAPMILLTGQDCRETDIEAMEAGATDYLVKQDLNPTSLERAIRYSLKQKKAEQRIKHLANHDGLTGLPNRAHFMTQLEWSIQICRRHKSYGCVLFLDLDHFKAINDTLGHDAGDELLMEVSRRLKDAVRGEDIVARLGGDEFVILMHQIDDSIARATDGVQIVVQKIQAAIRKKFDLAGKTLFVTSSIGGVTFPEPAETSEEILKCADLAMYESKFSGRDSFSLFNPGMEAAVQKELTMETALRTAVNNDELSLLYQPIVDIQNRQTIGHEVLVRWNNPDLGLVVPHDFIPLAAKSDLILQIDEWVIENALTVMAGIPVGQFLSLNVSFRQLKDAGFVSFIKRTLEKTGFRADQLFLEMQEGELYHHLEMVLTPINQLREMGLRFAIDGFGTGSGSLTALNALPIEMIKIDEAFSHDVLIDKKDAAIVRSIIALANDLNIYVFPKGIETIEQKDFMANNGAVHAQGNFFAEPKPMESANPMSKAG
ncbi:MAG: EAL domain-containing protein [Cohaesibacteraceae bacterium]|nr:EAL domain-containing protein [Cohaesibacteraceae bacterium]